MRGQHPQAGGKARAEETSLGPAITKQFIKTHGGILRIDGDLGIGTTVMIKLPPTAGRSSRQRAERSEHRLPPADRSLASRRPVWVNRVVVATSATGLLALQQQTCPVGR
jgi:hypothetical protein